MLEAEGQRPARVGEQAASEVDPERHRRPARQAEAEPGPSIEITSMFVRAAVGGYRVGRVEEEPGRNNERADAPHATIPSHSTMHDGLTSTLHR